MNRTDVDGVPVLWQDAPAPFSASLVFAVGARDETFRTVGVTHLIEHLVMATLPKSHLDCNAHVDVNSTIFHATGRPEAVVAFISAVCSALRELPLGRMKVEAGVLDAEGASGDHPAMCTALSYRYGLEGAGLLGTDGPGIRQVTADHVTDHLRRFFIRGNAVLVLTGPPPAELEVLLPEGPLPARRVERKSGLPLPARVTYDLQMPSLSIEAPSQNLNGTDVAALARILIDRMTDGLRHNLGLAYEVDFTIVRVQDGGVIAFWADGREGQLDKVAIGLWEALRRLAQAGPTLEEIAHDRAGLEEALADPRSIQGRLEANAWRLLTGRAVLTAEDARAEHDALTAAHLRDLAARSLTTALLHLPEEVDVDLADLPVVDAEGTQYRDAPVSGRVYRKRALALAPPSLHAVVGDAGASLKVRGNTITVLYADVVGLGVGSHDRLLVAHDGKVLELCRKHLRHSDEVFASVESRVARELWFDLPPD